MKLDTVKRLWYEFANAFIDEWNAGVDERERIRRERGPVRNNNEAFGYDFGDFGWGYYGAGGIKKSKDD